MSDLSDLTEKSKAHSSLSSSCKGIASSGAAPSLVLKEDASHFEQQYKCVHCSAQPSFISSIQFRQHLRLRHCKIEGGSFVCLYGTNSVCVTLPLEGVSDRDYEQHVTRQHLPSAQLGYSPTMSLGKGVRNADEKWGFFSSVQNLPSVLHDPKKGMRRDFFTKTWGESFIEVSNIPQHLALPQVEVHHVDSYCRRMRKRNKLMFQLEEHENLRKKQLQLAEEVSQNHFTTGGQHIIPPIYFSANFNLEDVNTFYSVFSHLASNKIEGVAKDFDSPVHSLKSNVMAKPTNSKAVEEQLLQHLEMIESKMCSHIASKSTAFFQSMSHLSEHMDLLRKNQLAVVQLRSSISRLKEDAVITPLKLLALPRRRHNILHTLRTLEVMSAVREVQSTVRVMLGRREFITALDLISTATQLLHSDLSAIRSFRNLSGELTEQERIIEKMVSIDFSKYVTEDLNRPLHDVRPLLEEDQLLAVVFGVLRLNKMDFVDNLKDEIYAAINATVKQCVAEAVSSSSTADLEDTTASSAVTTTSSSASMSSSSFTSAACYDVGETGAGAQFVVGEQARALPLLEWLEMMKMLTAALGTLLRRYKGMVQIMIQAVEASAGHAQTVAEDVQAATIVNMSTCGAVGSDWCCRAVSALRDGLSQACDYAHDRCAKLLHAKSRGNGLAKMSVKEFLTLSGIIEEFVRITEAVCGSKSAPFRMGLQGQCVVFVQRFHSDREGRLRVNLSNERWKPVPAPPDLRELCRIVDTTGKLVPPVQSLEGPVSITTEVPASCSPCEIPSDGELSTSEINSVNSSNCQNSNGNDQSNENDPPTNFVSESGTKRKGGSLFSSALSQIKVPLPASGSRAVPHSLSNTGLSLMASNKMQNGILMASVSSAAAQTTPETDLPNQTDSESACTPSSSLHVSQSSPVLSQLGDHSSSTQESSLSPFLRRKMSGEDEVVILGGERYLVVGVAVVVVRLMVEYAECANTLQMAAQNLLSGLADLLRRFNSDTCRLLLEAGAVSLGGLRTISIRHLALAHRCLYLLLALLPYLREHFAQLLKPALVDRTVDQLEREFREHCAALERKIICIAGDQVDKLLQSWQARSPVPSPAITNILKATSRLHEALIEVLSTQQVNSIFARFTETFGDKLRTHITRLHVQPVGPQSWVVTSELTFYFNHLTTLKVDPGCTQEQFSKTLWISPSR